MHPVATDPSSARSAGFAFNPAQPLPQLAAALAEGKDNVCSAWLLRVRKAIPKLQALSDVEALDDLPDVLLSIAAALSGDRAASARLMRIGGTHGITRFHQRLTAAELFEEHPVLRRVLMEQLRRRLERDLTAVESDALNSCLDRLVQLAGAAFTTLQEKEIRLENEATGRHLAMMSHDLRNTLNAAMLSMQMVRERISELMPAGGTDLPELLEDMDDCRRMAMGAVDAMTRVLEAERLRVGRVPLAMSEVDLCALLRSVRVASTRAVGIRSAGQAGADAHAIIEIDCDPGLQVQTDPDLLSTILQNLLGNAIRYAGARPIRIEAHPSGAGCEIAVIDRGPGIQPDQLRTIFGLFNRGTSTPAITTTSRTPGTAGSGLGLFIARRAADLLGAQLEVASVPGEGSTFTLRLPAAASFA